MLKLDAQKIEAAMADRNLTPADLAKKLGETRAAVHYLLWRISGGSQTQGKTAKKLCDALGLKSVKSIQRAPAAPNTEKPAPAEAPDAPAQKDAAA